jgi:hypothetical protein
MDAALEKIIKEISEELDIPIVKVRASILNLTNFTRYNMRHFTKRRIRWNKLFTFYTLDRRIEKKIKVLEKMEEEENLTPRMKSKLEELRKI